MKTYLFVRETKQQPTDLDEVVPNDVQVKTDTYCTIYYYTLFSYGTWYTFLEKDRVSDTQAVYVIKFITSSWTNSKQYSW